MEVVNCADDARALRRSWVSGRNWEVLSTETGETTDRMSSPEVGEEMEPRKETEGTVKEV